MRTRVWKGFKEFSEKPYFVGQVLLEFGRKKGCYEAVTRELLSERAACEALWVHIKSRRSL